MGGEDRSAPINTIDESVWETLRRDLLAVWSKMREVLYPKYLFGGTMLESPSGLRGAYSNIREAGLAGAREELVGLAGRAIDADHLLSQGNMSAGLRDWDLWGPLVFCLLLSLLLSFNQVEQKSLVFSGVFAMVWIGEAVVTMQIKLLGGNMQVFPAELHINANSLLVRSHRASVSSDTLFSHLLLQPFFQRSISLLFLEYLSILCWLLGRWQRVSASWADLELLRTGLELLSTHYLFSIWAWAVFALSAKLAIWGIGRKGRDDFNKV